MSSRLSELRSRFHDHLRGDLLVRSQNGEVSNADKKNPLSLELASAIADSIGGIKTQKKLAGQSAGTRFETIVRDFARDSFGLFAHLRPGRWAVDHITGRNGAEAISRFEQYEHLKWIEDATRADRKLSVVFGQDYVVSPDIVISREAEDIAALNLGSALVDDSVGKLASLRRKGESLPVLHASISCKWTMRSDRSQNARTEALSLLRQRKGRAPHLVVVTAEPLPTRLASLALGTGDIDCVYHFALYELIAAVDALPVTKLGRTQEEADAVKYALETMIEGRRLRDVSDLPLDLAV